MRTRLTEVNIIKLNKNKFFIQPHIYKRIANDSEAVLCHLLFLE